MDVTKPEPGKMGLQADGAFRTEEVKIYKPALSAAFAAGHFRWALQRLGMALRRKCPFPLTWLLGCTASMR